MHWDGPNLTWPPGMLYELAPFCTFIELYHFLWFITIIRGSHVKNQSLMSVQRKERSRAECGLSPGFHFQSSFFFPPTHALIRCQMQ